jgi:hypothetical protein
MQRDKSTTPFDRDRFRTQSLSSAVLRFKIGSKNSRLGELMRYRKAGPRAPLCSSEGFRPNATSGMMNVAIRHEEESVSWENRQIVGGTSIQAFGGGVNWSHSRTRVDREGVGTCESASQG